MRLTSLLTRIPVIFLVFLVVFSVSVATGCSKSKDADSDSESSEYEDSEEETDEESTDEEETPDEESEKESEDKKETKPEDESEEKKETTAEPDDKKAKSNKKPESVKHTSKAKRESRDVTKLWGELMSGNKRFMAGQHTTGKLIAARRSLVGGQKPDVIVISCSDSRLPPELVFDKNLGELFVIRTAGNIADPIALGSIEYAAEHLHSPMLVVLGHETCGAVGATLSGDEMPTKNLRAIVSTIKRSFKGVEECQTKGKGGDKCVKLNVTNSAAEMVKNSPILKELVADGSLHIVKAIYQMESGKVVRF